jgi:hypothetical protein
MADKEDHISGSMPETGTHSEPRRPLSDAALRALAEAEERRRARQAEEPRQGPVEVGGRKGPDPVRFGDWEKDGITSDF